MEKMKPQKPITAWAIMDGDQLSRIFVSDHRWNIYDCRDAARLNLKVYDGRGYGFRIARVEIKEIK